MQSSAGMGAGGAGGRFGSQGAADPERGTAVPAPRSGTWHRANRWAALGTAGLSTTTGAVNAGIAAAPMSAGQAGFGPLPDTVVALDGFGPNEDPVQLHEAEEELLRQLPAARRADFVAGRRAAARAMAALGHTGPVLREDRRPLFPPGARGSISHCAGHIAASIASTHPTVAATGIDLERADRLTWGTATLICTPREVRWVAAARRRESRLSVVFSTKEAVYKALCALPSPRQPTFHDAELHIAGNRIGICVTDDLLPKGHRIFGWLELLRGSHIVTCVAIVDDLHS
ncbi:4'-phosphopantetheinyl transferase superfamily protein [Streptomyces sp. ISL-1]|uniref:4'-phosphopantetheinyl transferase superfamily protein n=1 Tax=Streptomyces sp. ISL-1 TaxID=2817657 RepID=UPI001BEB750D|nr:4'-phosphopantetheinyl transferase superfamily protein [Streptomyces sp. ISL-1]MBT2393154.1 4'-phosphopantetheinyl transferase superfamily protein [Streptomyces sp. ISL-1]